MCICLLTISRACLFSVKKATRVCVCAQWKSDFIRVWCVEIDITMDDKRNFELWSFYTYLSWLVGLEIDLDWIFLRLTQKSVKERYGRKRDEVKSLRCHDTKVTTEHEISILSQNGFQNWGFSIEQWLTRTHRKCILNRTHCDCIFRERIITVRICI